jgi:hypothetical protein
MGQIWGPERIVTSGLVFALNAADRNSYAGTGTTWRDISGNGYNGTLTNGPTYNSNFGGYIAFDGSNDYVNVGIGTGINQLGTGDFTITGWFRRPNTGIFSGNIIGDYYTGATEVTGQWQVADGSTNNTGTSSIYVYRVGYSAGWLFFNTSTGLPTNTWVNFAVSRIGTNVTLYANGVNLGTATDSGSWGQTLGNLNVGIDGDNASEANNGWIANVSVYKGKGLTTAEVLQNYNAQKIRFGL